MNKKQWLVILLIALSFTIFRVILQAFMPSAGDGAPSAIVKAGLLPLAFTIYGLILFGSFAVVFVMIQEQLPGSKLLKGLSFGLSFSGMWVVYLLEPLPGTLKTPLIELISYAIADGLTFSLLGVVLGMFLGSDTKDSRKGALSYRIMSLVTVAIFFITARYLYYSVFKIYSSFADRPFLTMLWTIITGIWLGIMYLWLSPGIKVKTPIIKAVYFGVLVFGINYTLFNLFLPIVFDASVIEFLIRSLIDIIPVTIGAYVFEKANNRVGIYAERFFRNLSKDSG
jgi:hypothetical protein